MYVPTDTNPANITTRLLSPNAFVSCGMWWKDLDFPHFENIDMPCQSFLRPGEVSEEQKVATVLFAGSENYSALGKGSRIVGLDRYRNCFVSLLMSDGL